LTGADLSRANFTNAHLKGADLRDTVRVAVRGLDWSPLAAS
jgi:uncharacterized protein YjbI with pentapeptide repeats